MSIRNQIIRLDLMIVFWLLLYNSVIIDARSDIFMDDDSPDNRIDSSSGKRAPMADELAEAWVKSHLNLKQESSEGRENNIVDELQVVRDTFPIGKNWIVKKYCILEREEEDCMEVGLNPWRELDEPVRIRIRTNPKKIEKTSNNTYKDESDRHRDELPPARKYNYSKQTKKDDSEGGSFLSNNSRVSYPASRNYSLESSSASLSHSTRSEDNIYSISSASSENIFEDSAFLMIRRRDFKGYEREKRSADYAEDDDESASEDEPEEEDTDSESNREDDTEADAESENEDGQDHSHIATKSKKAKSHQVTTSKNNMDLKHRRKIHQKLKHTNTHDSNSDSQPSLLEESVSADSDSKLSCADINCGDISKGRTKKKHPFLDSHPSKSEASLSAFSDGTYSWYNCRLPNKAKNAEILCKKWNTRISCNLYCAHGMTFPEGIKRSTSCEFKKGKWSKKFAECEPFMDCTLQLKSPGSVSCTFNRLDKGTECEVCCDQKGKPGKPQKYKCTTEGRWSPKLPNCVESEGIDVKEPPKKLEHGSISYPKKYQSD